MRRRRRAGRAGGGRLAARADTLVVGYDREPDTLNRFSTHILEDIETCVVEGLVTTDEKMHVPLLAATMPTVANGGVAFARTAAWTSHGSCGRTCDGTTGRRSRPPT